MKLCRGRRWLSAKVRGEVPSGVFSIATARKLRTGKVRASRESCQEPVPASSAGGRHGVRDKDVLPRGWNANIGKGGDKLLIKEIDEMQEKVARRTWKVVFPACVASA